MGRFIIGKGISLEAQLPQQNSDQKIEFIETSEKIEESIQKITDELHIFEAKIDSNQDDLMQLMDQVNKLDMKTDNVQHVVNPEIKNVTINRDHTKDFEELYDTIFTDRKDTKNQLKKINSILFSELLKQKKINLAIGAGLMISIVLHLF